ncbi:FAR1 DNA-binding domain protein [Medicago truncatula]|uniref:FAR1 DNA-binding domain protein n=1 Tax=Medicago truncatula TaxID=3880 RepID=A0A072U1Q9_MEDTR|nr:FAR1 DNA-binding domain protein [Medicago truncatula]
MVVKEHHEDWLDADSTEVEYTYDLYEDEEHHISSDAKDDVDGDADDDVYDESVQQEGSISDELVGDRLVNVNFIASDENLKLEFGIVDEAYNFNYPYGKCKGFAIRKANARSNSSGIIIMRQFVCNKHGLRARSTYLGMIGREIIDVSPEQIVKQGFMCITKPKKGDM